ncbi:MAG: DUF192 domain-containing protein [Actinomycetota bacterium]
MSRRTAAAYPLLLLMAGCTSRAPAPAASANPATSAAARAETGTTVTFEGAPALRVEVAGTAAQRQRGLMDRIEVPAGTGMLFLFPAESTGGFWMKNTLVPLSIAYVNGDRVVSTAEMLPCPPAQTECPTYEAAGSYTAAVETASGFFAAHGVVPGSRMRVAGVQPTPR